MMSVYCLSFPRVSLHFRYNTEASTLAAEKVFGSFNNDMTLRSIVLGGGGREREEEAIITGFYFLSLFRFHSKDRRRTLKGWGKFHGTSLPV